MDGKVTGFWMGPLVTEEVQERLLRVTKCRVLVSMMMCFPIENGGPVQETICNDARATVYHCLLAMASA